MNARRNYRVGTSIMAAVVMAIMATMPVLAQTPSGETGRALDANPQIGSGGTNRIEGRVDYAARNALITGNVADGREFRGRVNYGAPTEFRGNLGSDDQFRFNARSFSSSLPVVQSGATYNIDPGRVVVPRSTGSAAYYTPVEAATAASRYVAPRGGSYSAAQIAADTARISLAPTPVTALPQQLDGRIFEVQATPLLGIRQVEQLRIRPAMREEDKLPDESQGVKLRLDTEIKPLPEEAQPTPTKPIDQQIQPRQPLTTMVDPGLTLGQQLNAYRLGGDARTFDQQVADIEKAMFRQLGSRTAQQGDDVYLDLLAAMRGEAPAPKATREARDPEAQLEAPTIEELQRVEDERQKALAAAAAAMEAEQQMREKRDRERRDMTLSPKERLEQMQKERLEKEEPGRKPDEAKEGEVPESLGGLLDTLESAQNMPRLATLAGEREDRINRLMRDAEADLAADRFFDAETKYRQVLQDAPDTPLAVAGQVHAQLGAAMIKSAAYNLRKLFEQHPELIGVRYDAKLLPPQKRLEFIHSQIMQELREAPRSETALVLAYLGYQINSRQLVRYGLAVAESRNPQDPLLPLLRHVWLSEKPAAVMPQAQPGTDAGRAEPQGSPPTPDAPQGVGPDENVNK